MKPKRIESDNYSKPKAIAFEAQAHGKFRDAEDSFERCDTDGFLSQWASGLTAQLLLAKAQIAEDDGFSYFERLFVHAGPEIDAKLIDGRYGACWLLSDGEADKYGRRFIPFAGSCVHCDSGDPEDEYHAYKRGPLKGKCKKCKGTGAGNSRIQKELGLVEGWVKAPAHAIITGRGNGLSGNAWVQIIEVDKVYEIYKNDIRQGV